MRFLLNMNVSRDIGRALDELGQEWVRVRDLGLAKATDQTIIETARQKQQVIVTMILTTAIFWSFQVNRIPR